MTNISKQNKTNIKLPLSKIHISLEKCINKITPLPGSMNNHLSFNKSIVS